MPVFKKFIFFCSTTLMPSRQAALYSGFRKQTYLQSATVYSVLPISLSELMHIGVTAEFGQNSTLTRCGRHLMHRQKSLQPKRY
jgi:hypothetical protein